MFKQATWFIFILIMMDRFCVAFAFKDTNKTVQEKYTADYIVGCLLSASRL